VNGRRLLLRCRSVGPASRPDYLAAVTRAEKAAAGYGAHFWTFEADGDGGTFVEFLEASSDEVLRALDGATRQVLTEAASGNQPSQVTIGPEGLRCTEVRAL
jgi:hypothetical protein